LAALDSSCRCAPTGLATRHARRWFARRATIDLLRERAFVTEKDVLAMLNSGAQMPTVGGPT
jgi:hypothetical protein